MTPFVPMYISFRVARACVSSELSMCEGNRIVTNTLTMALLASRDTKIQLSSGEPLSSVEVHFKVFLEPSAPAARDRDIGLDNVGFLCHVRDAEGKALVHGVGIWPDKHLPYYLLEEHLERRANCIVSSLQTLMEYDAPYVWATNRENALRLSSFSCHASQGKPTV